MARKKQDTPIERNEIIISRPMEEIMHDSMLPYAQHVILERALPRVEDGLKPVQRRILYTMLELSNTPDKPHRKSARIVGDCLGKYHPHGDTSVYDAMVRMAQPFNMSAMLVDGHGNFGSVDGDSAAAMRYTEARMTPLSLEMLRDIDKNTVNFSLNFDDTLREPDTLPGRFPNVLVNGASGIAVGLATNIPTHNLGETIDAAILVMEKPDVSLDELMQVIPAPDFPTGGYLLQSDEIRTAYQVGRAKLQIRAKVETEPAANGKTNLVITELPYQVNKAAMLEKILKLSEEKKGALASISDIRDESDRTGMRAVIELKRDADVQRVLAQLYKLSDLQVTFGVNMVAIADGKPMQLGLKDMLTRYIAYQKKIITKRTEYDLDQAKTRNHILEGLIRAVDVLDDIIKLIRASKSPKEAKTGLMQTFDFSAEQAQAILDMRLQRLTGLEIQALRKEFGDITKEVKRLEGILGSDKKLCAVIREEMLEIKQKYAVPRRTAIIEDKAETVEAADLVKQAEPCVVIETEGGFLKRMNPKLFQKKEETGDPVKNALELMDTSILLLFTSKGFYYTLDASQIPECKWKDRGIAPNGLLQGLQAGETMLALLPKEQTNGKTLLFYTAFGQIKRTQAEEYGSRKGRAAAINLKGDDELLAVEIGEQEQKILLVTRSGYSILFMADEVPVMGRAAVGVRGIALEAKDSVLYAAQTSDEGEMLMISDRGYAKRCLMVDFEAQRRGGKGVKAFPFNKNGSNGVRIVILRRVLEPFRFETVQHDGTRLPMSTEEVPIRTKADRGVTLIPVFMDNVVEGFKQLPADENEV